MVGLVYGKGSCRSAVNSLSSSWSSQHFWAKWQAESNTPFANTRIITLVYTFLNCKSEEEYLRGFPGSAVVKNPPANEGDMGSSPSPGRSHMPQSN